ncbi:MAG: protein kinase [Myxococcales bacterium]|nr:protein kinase [Myxococcales bacterium]
MSRQPGSGGVSAGLPPLISAVETVVSPSGRGISLGGEATQLLGDKTVAADSGPFADTGRDGLAPSVRAATTSSVDTSKELRRETTVLPLVEVRGEQVELVRKSNARYETIKELGRGGMGEVCLVRDNDIGRTVALKRLNRPPSHDPSALLRFISEVRTVGQLEHPNIVPIHDVGLDEKGNYYFVMK